MTNLPIALRGQSAFSRTAGSFVQPAADATVTVPFQSTTWLERGVYVLVDGGGEYLVVSLPTARSAVLRNLGYDENASPGATIGSGALVVVCGKRGEDGSGGGGGVPTSRAITAGAGLSGGGDLTQDRALAVVWGSDGASSCIGNDARLSNTRTPTDGTVTDAKVASGAAIAWTKIAPTYGTTSGTICQGNDSRLSDSRAPTGTAGGSLAGTYPSPTLSAVGPGAGAIGGGGNVIASVTLTAEGRVSAVTTAAAAAGGSAGLYVDLVAISTLTLSGEQTIEGTLTSGSRVLYAPVGATAGIYVTASGAWTRSTDYDSAGEILPGVPITVIGGTFFKGSQWYLETKGTIVVGTTSLQFRRLNIPLVALFTVSLTQSIGTVDVDLGVIPFACTATRLWSKTVAHPVGSGASQDVTYGTSHGGAEIVGVQTLTPASTDGTIWGRQIAQLGSAKSAANDAPITFVGGETLSIRIVTSTAASTGGSLQFLLEVIPL